MRKDLTLFDSHDPENRLVISIGGRVDDCCALTVFNGESHEVMFISTDNARQLVEELQARLAP
jgi:hypothetical protein